MKSWMIVKQTPAESRKTASPTISKLLWKRRPLLSIPFSSRFCRMKRKGRLFPFRWVNRESNRIISRTSVQMTMNKKSKSKYSTECSEWVSVVPNAYNNNNNNNNSNNKVHTANDASSCLMEWLHDCAVSSRFDLSICIHIHNGSVTERPTDLQSADTPYGDARIDLLLNLVNFHLYTNYWFALFLMKARPTDGPTADPFL